MSDEPFDIGLRGPLAHPSRSPEPVGAARLALLNAGLACRGLEHDCWAVEWFGRLRRWGIGG